MAEIMTPGSLSVTELNHYLREYLSEDDFLTSVAVRGQIASLHLHSSGHIYFNLLEGACSLSAVMFRGRAAGLRWRPQEGEQVVAVGSVAVYERTAACQLYVEALYPAGAGREAQALAALKRRLEEEGLFAPERKQPLPLFAHSVGVVTAADSAAWADIRRIAYGRFPGVELRLYPALVQGAQAPASLAAALAQADQGGHQVLLLGRGGGAEEDLSAFDTEQVVRAIAAVKTPLISAVGHESDVTLADLAADIRAATPTHGAMLAVPDMSQLSAELARLEGRLRGALSHRLSQAASRLAHLSAAPCLCRPQLLLASPGQTLADLECRLRLQRPLLLAPGRQTLADLERRLRRAGVQLLRQKTARWETAAARLRALDPLAVLARGYSVVRCQGQTLRQAGQARPGQMLEIQLACGKLQAQVCQVEEENGESKTQL